MNTEYEILEEEEEEEEENTLPDDQGGLWGLEDQ